MKKILAVLMLAVMMTFGGMGTALAMTNVVEVAQPTVLGSALIDFVVNYVVPILGTALLALATMAINSIVKKNKYLALFGLEQHLTTMAEKAVRVTEERAKNYAKQHGGQVTTGSKKLDLAMSILVQASPKILTPAEAAQYVEDALAKIPGLGATADKAHVSQPATSTTVVNLAK